MANIVGRDDAIAQFSNHVNNLTGEGKTINIAQKTGEETNAEAVRERNLQLKNKMSAELQRQKSMALETGGQAQQQTGQGQQQNGQMMMAMSAALLGAGALSFGATVPQAMALAAAGTMLIQQGGVNIGQGEQKVQQAPPIAQQSQQTQQVADQHGQKADQLELASSFDNVDNGADEEIGASEEVNNETANNVGDSDVASSSLTEEELAIIEDTDLVLLADVSNEVVGNASDEDMDAYYEFMDGKSEEGILEISNQFMDATEDVSSENYIEKFLDFALSKEDNLNLENIENTDNSDYGIADASEGETNTIINSEASEVVEASIADNINKKGTVSREGLDEIRSGIFETDGKG